MGAKARSAVDRFAEKIALTDTGCIDWIASTNGPGYGTFFAGPAYDNKVVFAHRWSYEHHVGPIPHGLEIDHLCSNRACVNPGHMEVVTRLQNLMRSTGISARNAAKTHCPSGHPYAGDNLSIVRATNNRVCITCRRANQRARSALRKGA